MKNLYIETAKALFEANLKPWNVSSVTMVLEGEYIELEWDEFEVFARKINYKPTPRKYIVNTSLVIHCKEKGIYFKRVMKQDGEDWSCRNIEPKNIMKMEPCHFINFSITENDEYEIKDMEEF